MPDPRSAREKAIDRYLADPTDAGRPLGLTERELIQAIARRLGITEQWYRRRYLKESREKALQRAVEIARIHKIVGDA